MNGIHKPCILWLSQFPKVALQQETLFVKAVGVEMMRAGMPAPSTGASSIILISLPVP